MCRPPSLSGESQSEKKKKKRRRTNPMKPNEPKRQEVEKQDYWQHEKHVKL